MACLSLFLRGAKNELQDGAKVLLRRESVLGIRSLSNE